MAKGQKKKAKVVNNAKATSTPSKKGKDKAPPSKKGKKK